MTSFVTDFETHAIWQGYIEDPTAKDYLARKACTIALSKVQGSCHKTSNNQPYSQVWISLGDSIPGLYYIAWLMQESVSSRTFVKKKGMNHVQSNGRSQQTPSTKFGKGKIQR